MFENTNIEEIDGTPITATTSDGHRIHCGHVLIATHVPLQGKTGLASATLLQSKLAPYSSYAIGGWVKRGTVPEALFWDTGDPYDYLRVDRRHDHDYVIFGGEDHKTGQVEDTAQCFARLEQRLKASAAGISVTHRWTGQVIETNDGLPYIGETAERQYVATGFSGNGMTFGTLSAMMFADSVDQSAESVEGACSIRGARKSRAGSGTTSRKTRTTRTISFAIGLPARRQRALRTIPARHRRDHRRRWTAGGGLSRLRREDSRAFSGLHAHGLLRALEQRRMDVGLPVPRIAVQGERRRAGGSRRSAAAGDQASDEKTEQKSMRAKGAAAIVGRSRRAAPGSDSRESRIL